MSSDDNRRFSLKSLLPEIAVGAGFGAWLLYILSARMPVWGDEFFTYRVSSFHLNDTVTAVLNDAHPPLYWIITNSVLWSTVDDILVLRIVSAVFGILAIWIGSLIIHETLKDKFDTTGKKLAFLFFAITSPFLILFFTMARYYSLFAFLVTLSIYLKIRDSKSWGIVAGIILVDTLMLYTNFFAGLILVASWIYLLFAKELKFPKSKLISIIATPLVLFSPLLIYLFNTVSKISSQSFFQADFGSGIKSIFARLIYTWHVFVSGEFIYPWQISGIVIAILSVFLIFHFFLRTTPKIIKPVVIIILIPALILVIATVFTFSLGIEFLPSRLGFAQIFVLMSVFLGLTGLKNKAFFYAAFLILILGNLHADMKLIQRQNFLHSTYIIPWSRIMDDIKKDADFRTDIILYDDAAMEYQLNMDDFLPQAYNIAALDFSIEELIKTHPEKRIWLVFSRRDRTPDQKLDQILQYVSLQSYSIEHHYKYVEESESTIKIKERLLGRPVEKYKKELILFKPPE